MILFAGAGFTRRRFQRDYHFNFITVPGGETLFVDTEAEATRLVTRRSSSIVLVVVGGCVARPLRRRAVSSVPLAKAIRSSGYSGPMIAFELYEPQLELLTQEGICTDGVGWWHLLCEATGRALNLPFVLVSGAGVDGRIDDAVKEAGVVTLIGDSKTEPNLVVLGDAEGVDPCWQLQYAIRLRADRWKCPIVHVTDKPEASLSAYGALACEVIATAEFTAERVIQLLA